MEVKSMDNLKSALLYFQDT